MQPESKTKSCKPEERRQKGKEHFKNLLVNPSKTTGKHTEKNINNLRDITFGHFREEELDAELKNKIKRRKAAGLDKVPSEESKTRKFDDLLHLLCNAEYK